MWMVSEDVGVGRYRAILTTRDRERISGKVDVDENKRYQAVSRARNRIEELEEDVEILAEHHPELLAELREAVCEE